MLKTVINVGTTKLQAMVRRANSQGKFKAIGKIIGEEYADYTLDRFDRLSNQKAGEWSPLSAITLARKAPETRKLYETGDIRKSLASARANATDAGYRTVIIPSGVRIEFNSSSARHKRAKMPIAKLMLIHHRGNGRVPQRRVLPKSLPQRRQFVIRKRATRYMLYGEE